MRGGKGGEEGGGGREGSLGEGGLKQRKNSVSEGWAFKFLQSYSIWQLFVAAGAGLYYLRIRKTLKEEMKTFPNVEKTVKNCQTVQDLSIHSRQ